jgi:hypothetical protein
LAALIALYVPAALGPSRTPTLPLTPEILVRGSPRSPKMCLKSKSFGTRASVLDIFIGHFQNGGCAVA